MQKGIIFVPFMTGKGGTEAVIHNLFKSINREKINLIVYSIGGSDNYEWTQGVPTYIQHISNKRLIRTAYYSTLLPLKICQIIKKEQPDFVFSTNPVMWFLAKQSVKILHFSIPVISWYHYSLLQKPIKPFLLKSADAFLAISSGIKNQLINLGQASSKIYLIYNPVVSDYHLIPRPVHGTKFIYLGRVDYDQQKNVQELIHACKGLKGEWKLSIYGDSKKANQLKVLIDQLKLSSHIQWEGFINNPWEKIGNVSALLLTSKYEGLPMVLCEAISHGVFIISSDIETGPADIINKNNGKLYESGNVDRLHQIMQSIIDKSKVLPNQKQIIESSKLFSVEKYGRRFTDAILSILDKYKH